MAIIKFPFGKADTQSISYAAAIPAEVSNSETILTVAQLTGNATLNLTVHSEMEPGSNLLVKVSIDGTNRTLTLGTGITGAAQVLTANKSYALTFKYSGSTFTHLSTNVLN